MMAGDPARGGVPDHAPDFALDRALDWPGLMRVGIGQLKLMPDAFWRLTPAELALLLGERSGPKPMSRAALRALAQDFPDRGMNGG
jgi:uncharacterized phage protein (TIGR02216 family)